MVVGIKTSLLFLSVWSGFFGVTDDEKNTARTGDYRTRKLEINFYTKAKIGKQVLPKGKITVRYDNENIKFIHPSTHQTLGEQKCRPRKLKAYRHAPHVQMFLSKGKRKFTLRFSNQNFFCDVNGVFDENLKLADRSVNTNALKDKAEVHGIPDNPSDAQLLHQALKRYKTSVEHCGYKAKQRMRRQNLQKYALCACPIIERWRLPKLRQKVRVSSYVLPYQSGYSFLALPNGKVDGCRMWIGNMPPKEEPEILEKLIK